MLKQNKRWKVPGQLALGATALMLISISGCGGGGGGSRRVVATPGPTNLPSIDPPPTPVPTPTPSPVPTPTPSPDGSCPINPDAYQPNYARALLDGYTTTNPDGSTDTQPPSPLLRHAGYPLRVYFNENGNATAARKAYAIEGFNQWVTGTSNRVRYNVITDKAQADVVVTFQPFVQGTNLLGLATLVWNIDTNVIFEFFQDDRPNIEDGDRSGHLLLNYTGNLRTDRTTAAHEFGHILGVFGHSPNDLDQMFFRDNPNSSGLVTTADINTLRVSHCDNFLTRTPRSAQRRTRNSNRIRVRTIRDTFESMGLPRPGK